VVLEGEGRGERSEGKEKRRGMVGLALSVFSLFQEEEGGEKKESGGKRPASPTASTPPCYWERIKKKHHPKGRLTFHDSTPKSFFSKKERERTYGEKGEGVLNTFALHPNQFSTSF